MKGRRASSPLRRRQQLTVKVALQLTNRRNARADRFVGLGGDEGREAVAELLRRGEAIGAFDQPVRVEFV